MQGIGAAKQTFEGAVFMDYLKFNCFDLAAQNISLRETYKAVQSFSEELTGIFGALDPQIKSYEEINNRLTDAKTAAAEVTAGILSATNALDRVIDVYYSAENKVRQAVDELPAGVSFRDRALKPFNSFAPAQEISTSTINSADLVLEDWLAELIVKQSY